MSKEVFIGTATALVTPFKDDGIDFETFGKIVDFQIENGIDALVVCGTTGEASTMPDEEHLDAIRFVVEKTAKRVPVIAGTGSNDTKHAIYLSKKAQELGADAILSVTPYYNKTTQSGLYEHFRMIANSIDIPMILYNVPSRTGLNIDAKTVQSLSKIENIVGLKECNLAQAPHIIGNVRDDFAVYSGNDPEVLQLLAIGGKGLISVASNVIPKDVSTMVRKWLRQDIIAARELYYKILPFAEALFIEVNPVPVKKAMSFIGFDCGKCRMPLTDMLPANEDKLAAAARNYGLI
ncbi:MAG: 4-hydroxy-tetrahydrodipicolinate synthase [Clostridia bacterium]|jgi:4-hydroxy-tetrahydrodipicolinate synthase